MPASREILPVTPGRVLFAAKASVLKCHADKIGLPPDHAAPADGVKIIECQFKARRQDVKASQLYSRAAIGNVPNPASEYAALRIEKYQRALRDRRSADGSSFNHRSPPVKLKPRIGQIYALSKQTNRTIDIGTVELNRSGLEYSLPSSCTSRFHSTALG